MKKFTDKINESVDEKIPTAEEFMLDTLESMDQQEVERAMIEFAKLHVESALKAASINAETKEEYGNPYDTDDRYYVVDKESILKAYPIENIK